MPPRASLDGVPLSSFSPAVRDWFLGAFEQPDAGAGAGLAGDRHGRARAHLGAHRLGQDAGRVPVGARPPRPRDPLPEGAAAAHPPGLRLAAEGALLRHRAQPARAAAGDRRAMSAWPIRTGDTSAARAGGDGAQAARHPDHDARVAVPDPHLAGARDAHRRRGGDRRRDPRGRLDQARRAPRADARAPGRQARAAIARTRRAAHRPAAPRRTRWRRSGASWSGRSARADRRRGRAQAAGPANPRAGRVDGRARPAGGRRHRRSAPASGGDQLAHLPAARPRAARSGRRSTPSC